MKTRITQQSRDRLVQPTATIYTGQPVVGEWLPIATIRMNNIFEGSDAVDKYVRSVEMCARHLAKLVHPTTLRNLEVRISG